MCDHRDGHIDWAMNERLDREKDNRTEEQKEVDFRKQMESHPSWS